MAYQMARDLGKAGHNVVVLTSNYGFNEVQFDNGPFEIKALPCYARWGFYVTQGLISWTRTELTKFDIVHMHTFRTYQNAIVGHYARKFHVPYIISAHGTLPVIVERKMAKHLFDILVGKKILAGASKFIAVSPYEVSQYQSGGILTDKIQVIYNGLDLGDFEQLPDRGIFRRRFGIPPEAPMVLYLGRLHRRKQIDLLIHSFSAVKHRVRNAVLCIVGPDDGNKQRLVDLIDILSLTESVFITGPLFGLEKLNAYVDADVLASPAQYEIFGLVPFEALMCGTPVVATDDCGSGQIIEEAKAGLIISNGNLDELTNALINVLETPSTNHRLVINGRAYIRANLDFSKTINDLINLYQVSLAT